MKIAIDPGPLKSGWLVYESTDRGLVTPLRFGELPNDSLMVTLFTDKRLFQDVAIEWIQSYGMAVGAEVFDTARWVGIFQQAVGLAKTTLITRGECKLHLCRSSRAKDANVRQAILDLYGGKDVAQGKKKTPGPLYGVSGHVWSALAVALTRQAQLNKGK